MTPTFMAYLVGPIVRDYAGRFPNIHLEIFELSMDDIEMGLADDSLDIAIAFDKVRNPDIESIPAFVETLGLMVGREHSLYDHPTALTTEEVARLDFALLTSDFATRTCIDEYFTKARITPNILVEVNSVNTLLEVIRHTAVATILPEPIATQDRALSKLAMKDRAPQRGAALLRRKNNYHSAASSAFLDLLLSRSSSGASS